MRIANSEAQKRFRMEPRIHTSQYRDLARGWHRQVAGRKGLCIRLMGLEKVIEDGHTGTFLWPIVHISSNEPIIIACVNLGNKETRTNVLQGIRKELLGWER